MQAQSKATARIFDAPDDAGLSYPVCSFQPHGWGLYDMHGNTGEWVQPCDGADCPRRMIRGGSFVGASRGRFGSPLALAHVREYGLRLRLSRREAPMSASRRAHVDVECPFEARRCGRPLPKRHL